MGKKSSFRVEISYMTMSRWIFMQVDVDVELNPSNLSLCTPMENTFCQLRCSSTKTKTSERSTKTKSFNFKYSYFQKPKHSTAQHSTAHQITQQRSLT